MQRNKVTIRSWLTRLWRPASPSSAVRAGGLGTQERDGVDEAPKLSVENPLLVQEGWSFCSTQASTG